MFPARGEESDRRKHHHYTPNRHETRVWYSRACESIFERRRLRLRGEGESRSRLLSGIQSHAVREPSSQEPPWGAFRDSITGRTVLARVHEDSWEVSDGFVIRTVAEDVFRARYDEQEV